MMCKSWKKYKKCWAVKKLSSPLRRAQRPLSVTECRFLSSWGFYLSQRTTNPWLSFIPRSGSRALLSFLLPTKVYLALKLYKSGATLDQFPCHPLWGKHIGNIHNPHSHCCPLVSRSPRLGLEPAESDEPSLTPQKGLSTLSNMLDWPGLTSGRDLVKQISTGGQIGDPILASIHWVFPPRFIYTE